MTPQERILAKFKLGSDLVSDFYFSI